MVYHFVWCYPKLLNTMNLIILAIVIRDLETVKKAESSTYLRSKKTLIFAVLLSLHAVDSYILLTANLDDMHSLAKQIAESPVANQITDIIRRATTILKESGVQGKNSTRKAQMRSDSQMDEKQFGTDVGQPQTNEGQPQTNGDQDKAEKTDQNQPNPAEGQTVASNTALAAELNANSSDSSSELSGETNGVKPHHSPSRRDVGFALLGRNASYYLNSIKKIFENI